MRFAGQQLAAAGINLKPKPVDIKPPAVNVQPPVAFNPVQPAPLPQLATMEPPVMVANAQFANDMMDAAANGGVSGSGARAMPRAGVGGGGAAIGSEQLEDIYLGNDDSDFGTYDPAERSFFPGV